MGGNGLEWTLDNLENSSFENAEILLLRSASFRAATPFTYQGVEMFSVSYLRNVEPEDAGLREIGLRVVIPLP